MEEPKTQCVILHEEEQEEVLCTLDEKRLSSKYALKYAGAVFYIGIGKGYELDKNGIFIGKGSLNGFRPELIGFVPYIEDPAKSDRSSALYREARTILNRCGRTSWERFMLDKAVDMKSIDQKAELCMVMSLYDHPANQGRMGLVTNTLSRIVCPANIIR